MLPTAADAGADQLYGLKGLVCLLVLSFCLFVVFFFFSFLFFFPPPLIFCLYLFIILSSQTLQCLLLTSWFDKVGVSDCAIVKLVPYIPYSVDGRQK